MDSQLSLNISNMEYQNLKIFYADNNIYLMLSMMHVRRTSMKGMVRLKRSHISIILM